MYRKLGQVQGRLALVPKINHLSQSKTSADEDQHLKNPPLVLYYTSSEYAKIINVIAAS